MRTGLNGMEPVAKDGDRAREAREVVGRFEALIDVLLAQLAHTNADSLRWRRLRDLAAAEARLTAQVRVLESVIAAPPANGRVADPPHANRSVARVARCARRWLRRIEPALALFEPPLDLEPSNSELFATLREQAEQRRAQLYAVRSTLPDLPAEGLARWAEVGVSAGLGLLPELLEPDGVTPPVDPLDQHIRSMLADADAWCAPNGGRTRAVLGLARLAEAVAVLARTHPHLDGEAMFGRYVGAPEIYQLADLQPGHILAFDAVFARGAPINDPAFRALEQEFPERFAALQPVFEARLAIARQLRLRLPNRPFDALNIRLGVTRMRQVASAFDGDRLEQAYERLGAEALARAVMQAGPPAMAQLVAQLEDTDSVSAILTAFEPVGHGLGALAKTVSGPGLLDLVEAVGRADLHRQLRALRADGLKNLMTCVGLPGSRILLTARVSDELLTQLREDLGRRSIRLTLQVASGSDVARLLRRGLTAQQLQGIILGAEGRMLGLGSQVVGRLATLPGSDSQLQSRVTVLNRAMGWAPFIRGSECRGG